MRYGAMASQRGTRREIGGMSAAGDQGEAQAAWGEGGKRDKRVWQQQGVRVEGREEGANVISTTLPPPSGCGLLELFDKLAQLVVRLVPRNDLLAVDAAWLIAGLLGTLDVVLDAADAECVSALQDLRAVLVHWHLAVTAECAAAESAELVAVGFDDAVEE